MNEKAGLIGYPPQRVPLHKPQARSLAWGRFVTRVAKWVCLLGLLALVAKWHMGRGAKPVPEISLAEEEYSVPAEKTPNYEPGDWKVPLEAHIMSKCPDALDCLEMLVVPAMAIASAQVNFTLSFIGTPTDTDDGVSCKHGPTECLGNIIELCAAHLYPDPKISLGFTLCLTREYDQIPAQTLIQNCALEHGIDFDKLNECASKDDGGFGMDLLRQSVKHSQEVGAGISCTIRLNETLRCVRDDGEWKDCDSGSSVYDLLDDIDRLWNDGNSES